jgi:hypothetical protein
LDHKVKTSLDETRLLILGPQMLLGFEFQSFFQDGFEDMSDASKTLSVAGFVLVVLSTGLLVIPSMQHPLVEQGQSSIRLFTAASFYAGIGVRAITTERTKQLLYAIGPTSFYRLAIPGVRPEKSNNIAHSALDFRSIWSVHAGPNKGPDIWIKLQPMLSPKLF